MLDINEIGVNKISKDYILSKISHNDIFTQFFKTDITIGKRISSPLHTDKNPSFVIYTRKNNDLFFIDFSTGKRGDAFSLVEELYGCDFREALKIILNEFGLESFNGYSKAPLIKVNITDNKVRNTKLQISRRRAKSYDISFWKRFGISRKTLNKFRVFPISHFFLNDVIMTANKLSYAFIEKIDDDYYFKIYQPLSKKAKWISSMPAKVLFGYTQLPPTGEVLIITKALKEVMSIYETLGIPAIAVQSESVVMKETVLKALKKRFKRVISLFDNDPQGKKIALKYEELGVPKILIKDHKNYTDKIDEDSLESAKKELKTLINGRIN